MNCKSCGGLLGRDCFNEQECIEISNSINQYHIIDLEKRISYLENILDENGIQYQGKVGFDTDIHGYRGEHHYPQTTITWDEKLGKWDDKPF